MAPLRVVVTSDTHGEHRKLHAPAGDILVHAGDLAYRDETPGLLDCMDWFAGQPHPCKILVGGNHDHSLDPDCPRYPSEQRNFQRVQAALAAHVQRGSFLYLAHQSAQVRVNGRTVNVFGSPLTPEHGFGAWRYHRSHDTWASSVPAGTDLLITHGPPRGVLDRNRRGEACGCDHLLRRVQQVQPRLHVFGHIHEDFGACTKHWPGGGSTVFVNAAMGFPNQYPDRTRAVELTLP